MTIFDPALYVPSATFMGAPLSYDLGSAKAAILGIPFDCGLHAVRVGSRLGPAAIREQSILVRAYGPPDQDFSPIVSLGVVDCGNSKVAPSAIPRSHRGGGLEDRPRRRDAGHHGRRRRGDAAIAARPARCHSCAPCTAAIPTSCCCTSTRIRTPSRARAASASGTTPPPPSLAPPEEGLVLPQGSFHVGARGPTYLPQAYSHAERPGYRVIPDYQCRFRGMEDVVREIRAEHAGRPVYLCLHGLFRSDLRPRRVRAHLGRLHGGLRLLRALSGLRFVAFDVNTVSPPHDTAGMSEFLAASCVREFLFLAVSALEAGQPPGASASVA